MKRILLVLLLMAGSVHAGPSLAEFKQKVAAQDIVGALQVFSHKIFGGSERKAALQALFTMVDPATLDDDDFDLFRVAFAKIPKTVFNGLQVSGDWRSFLQTPPMNSVSGGVNYTSAPSGRARPAPSAQQPPAAAPASPAEQQKKEKEEKHKEEQAPPMTKLEQAFAELGLTPDATESEVRKAYKKLALKRHPDRGGSEESFKRLVEAYSTIQAYLGFN